MSTKELRLPNYGGQALIEGVLMRGKFNVAAAFRLPNGQIKIQTEQLSKVYRHKIFELPFIRGLLLLGDALFLGYRYLTISANYQVKEDEKIEGPASFASLILALLFALAIFFLVPALISKLIANLFSFSSFITNLLEGIIRLSLVILYLWAIRRIPEILNVFKYHGAEHKTINAFEAGAELTPQNVSKFSLYHPRCGTSFILTVVIFSMIIFTLMGSLSLPAMIMSRIFLVAPIVMISYEYIRWVSNNLDHPFVKILAIPNLKLQTLTTEEPNETMLEVAISAFLKMYDLEKSTQKLI